MIPLPSSSLHLQADFCYFELPLLAKCTYTQKEIVTRASSQAGPDPVHSRFFTFFFFFYVSLFFLILLFLEQCLLCGFLFLLLPCLCRYALVILHLFSSCRNPIMHFLLCSCNYTKGTR